MTIDKEVRKEMSKEDKELVFRDLSAMLPYGVHVKVWLKANMDLVHSYSNGPTFMEISKSAFKSLGIIIPDKEMVNEFTTYVKPIFV